MTVMQGEAFLLLGILVAAVVGFIIGAAIEYYYTGEISNRDY